MDISWCQSNPFFTNSCRKLAKSWAPFAVGDHRVAVEIKFIRSAFLSPHRIIKWSFEWAQVGYLYSEWCDGEHQQKFVELVFARFDKGLFGEGVRLVTLCRAFLEFTYLSFLSWLWNKTIQNNNKIYQPWNLLPKDSSGFAWNLLINPSTWDRIDNLQSQFMWTLQYP